jgi:hypothetical protein
MHEGSFGSPENSECHWWLHSGLSGTGPILARLLALAPTGVGADSVDTSSAASPSFLGMRGERVAGRGSDWAGLPTLPGTGEVSTPNKESH